MFKIGEVFNVEVFKWECVISKRAAQIGIGPVVRDCALCMGRQSLKSKKQLLYGVIIMARCQPLAKTSKLDLTEINRMLNVLHQNGVVHRDLAKRNIMTTSTGGAGKYVFIDYGLSVAFPGPVPEAYRVWDHAFLTEDIPKYKEIPQVSSMKKMIAHLSKNRFNLEEMTAQYFPIEMLVTMKMPLAGRYLNNIDDDVSEKEEDKLDAILIKRLKGAAVSDKDIEETTKETGGSGTDILAEVHTITTITGLKAMAKMLGIPGYSKYNSDRKEELRTLMIETLIRKVK